MTTNVKVLNEGPKAVKIEVQGRDEGRFVQTAEIGLDPGEFATFMLHDTQSIQVFEVKEEAE